MAIGITSFDPIRHIELIPLFITADLPNLRQKDNYVECQLCLKSFDYDNAAIIGKNYIQTIMKLQNKQYADA